MRINGHNVLAIILAAAVMYGIGAAIYTGLSEQWMALSGVTEETFAGQEWRMALSPIMPLLLAFGLSLAIKWRGAAGWMGGMGVGFWMALCFVFASRLYMFVYSVEQPGLLGIDAAHIFAINLVGGAIIGAWK
ncbi:MAG: DUF1761 family protein [Hyphomonadaceae bacterium]|nr:DUF1761 family protein [Hyphomonadaceae bacterium]